LSFAEVKESRLYLPALQTIFTLVLLDRLHGFRALLDIEDSSNEWKSVVNREAEYLGLLIKNILTISHPKPEDQRALENLADKLASSERLLQSRQTLSELIGKVLVEAPESSMAGNAIGVVKELFLEFLSRVTANLIKPGPM
jgi:hypothetical protein